MKITYETWNAKPGSLEKVAQANTIIAEYQADGYVVTLRQLYYQFVSRGLIENTDREYKNLGTLITKGRMAGLVDWNAIEDRVRNIMYNGQDFHYVQESDRDLVDAMSGYIRFDYWDRQPCYVEVWVEKEALGNVIERACNPHQVPYMSCKGYMSASAVWKAGQRFQSKIEDGKECHLIHLGDHDPSGIDMTRDNRDRVDIFSGFPGEVNVDRIALNMPQIDKFNPPPNPAKETDSRSAGYIAKYGDTSWELDALEPTFINKIITEAVEDLIDIDAWDKVIDEEDEKRRVLRLLSNQWDEIKMDLV